MHEQDLCISSQTIVTDWAWAEVPALLPQLLRSACVCASYGSLALAEMGVRAHQKMRVWTAFHVHRKTVLWNSLRRNPACRARASLSSSEVSSWTVGTFGLL